MDDIPEPHPVSPLAHLLLLCAPSPLSFAYEHITTYDSALTTSFLASFLPEPSTNYRIIPYLAPAKRIPSRSTTTYEKASQAIIGAKDHRL
jgi:hypothetical protein